MARWWRETGALPQVGNLLHLGQPALLLGLTLHRKRVQFLVAHHNIYGVLSLGGLAGGYYLVHFGVERDDNALLAGESHVAVVKCLEARDAAVADVVEEHPSLCPLFL